MNKKNTDLNIIIPYSAAEALRTLEAAGYEAWCVGGCVRDAIRGDTPHDWDVCTSALPEQTLSAFSKYKTIPTGLKHGTVTAVIKGEQIEITTYRTDGDYLNHRSPEQVQFVRDIRSDLERRDFTMNAICANLHGEILDLFGGCEDISAGIIRCVGDPKKRFDEDALRILRAVRFAAKTGFEIEKNTADAAIAMRSLLDSVSAERILSELRSLLVQRYAGDALRKYRGIIAQIIPEAAPCFDFPQNNPHHCFDVWTHITHSVDHIDPDQTLRTVMLLHDIGKPDKFFADENGISHFKQHQLKSADYANEILLRLKSDTASRKYICKLIAEHDNRIPPQKKAVRRFIAKYDYDFFYDWLEVRRADTMAQSDYRKTEKLAELDKLEEIAHELQCEEACMKLCQLKVNGKDMISLGIKGKEIGETLNALLSEVIEENLPNEREALLAAAVNMKGSVGDE